MCSEEKVYRAFIRNGVSEIQGALKIQDYFEALGYMSQLLARERKNLATKCSYSTNKSHLKLIFCVYTL